MTTQAQTPAQGSTQTSAEEAPPEIAPEPAPRVMPRASSREDSTGGPGGGSRDGIAPLLRGNERLVHLILFIAGAVLLPAGIVVICIGWYGIARSPYQYDQLVYLISGGALGLGITLVGGFLYFGSWLARVAADQRDSQRQLNETLAKLADAISVKAPDTESPAPAQPPAPPTGSAGNGGVRAAPAPARPRDPDIAP